MRVAYFFLEASALEFTPLELSGLWVLQGWSNPVKDSPLQALGEFYMLHLQAWPSTSWIFFLVYSLVLVQLIELRLSEKIFLRTAGLKLSLICSWEMLYLNWNFNLKVFFLQILNKLIHCLHASSVSMEKYIILIHNNYYFLNYNL